MRARAMVAISATTLLVTSLLAAPASGAGGTRYLDVLFDEVRVTTDLEYGSAVNSRGEQQTLLFDLYEPVGDDLSEGRALYIWVHGSGFRFGDKSFSNPLTDYARRGWVGMSISYRLRPELPPNAAVGIVTEPTSIQTAQAAARDAQHDLQAAVRYARAHADELGIDPDRIVAGGKSAGGITALAAAFNEDDTGDSGTPGHSSRIAAAISHSGAYAPVLQGGFPSAGAPPIAVYHGTTDEQVPYPTAPLACTFTLLVGNTCEFVTFVGRTHRGIHGADLALEFLYRHVIEPAPGSEAAVGAVVPTDPELIVDETSYFLEYVANALGVPLG